MAKRTQKTGATARFGPRYGVSVRRNAGSAMRKKQASYSCPVCQYQRVKRQSVGIWSCSKCGHTFAGGAWEPYTRASAANQRVIRRGLDGTDETDLTALAAQAAMNYEASIAEEKFGAEADEEE